MARFDAITQLEAPTTGRQLEALNQIERKILDFMVGYLRTNTYQPSVREIGERFGIKSTKTVSEHLQALADKGCLERDPSRSRGVKILGLDLSDDTVAVPCFTDMPTSEGTQDADTYVSIDRQLGSGEAGSFMVRARAGEMGVLGVTEGDLLLVSPGNVDDMAEGSVVVAQIGGASAFYRLQRNGPFGYLQSLHQDGVMTPVDDADLRIVGRITGFFRRMDEVAPVNLTTH